MSERFGLAAPARHHHGAQPAEPLIDVERFLAALTRQTQPYDPLDNKTTKRRPAPVVRGKVSGSIRARQIQLSSTARIEGDIVHAALSVESGAFFDGHCRHSSDPLKDAPAPAKPAAASNKSDSASKSDDGGKPPSAGKSNDPLSSLEPPMAASKSGF